MVKGYPCSFKVALTGLKAILVALKLHTLTHLELLNNLFSLFFKKGDRFLLETWYTISIAPRKNEYII